MISTASLTISVNCNDRRTDPDTTQLAWTRQCWFYASTTIQGGEQHVFRLSVRSSVRCLYVRYSSGRLLSVYIYSVWRDMFSLNRKFWMNKWLTIHKYASHKRTLLKRFSRSEVKGQGRNEVKKMSSLVTYDISVMWRNFNVTCNK